MSAIILDTETTQVDNPEVIEFAWADVSPEYKLGGIHVERFKPTHPIQLGAMAVHHIIPADLEGCRPFWGVEVPNVTYAIGHNVEFDLRAIEVSYKPIDTLALARFVWPDLDSHSLGALTYHTQEPAIARQKLRNAHAAAADIQLCFELLQSLLEVFGPVFDTGLPPTFAQLHALSNYASYPQVMPFGKHKGERMRNVPSSWTSWYCRLPDADPRIVAALKGRYPPKPDWVCPQLFL